MEDVLVSAGAVPALPDADSPARLRVRDAPVL